MQFIQLYRLLSVHSLIKPPKGSNVTGGDMLTTLFGLNDLLKKDNQRRKIELEKKLDEMLDNGDFDIIEPYFDYQVRDDIDPPALLNFVGYVVRRARRGSVAKTCEHCFKTIEAYAADPERKRHVDEGLIEHLSHGYLFTPTDELMDMVYRCETAILNVLEKEGVGELLIFDG